MGRIWRFSLYGSPRVMRGRFAHEVKRAVPAVDGGSGESRASDGVGLMAPDYA